MAHSKEAHGKMNGLGTFHAEHWEKKPGEPMDSDLRYTQGEMANPEHLKASVNALSSYVKKNRMKY